MEEDESLDLERWLPVVGYEHLYSVSNFGRVRRDAPGRGTRPGWILRARIRKDKYAAVNLTSEGTQITHLVHRLVAAAFLGSCPDGQEVAHADGDRSNNKITNLRYADHLTNILDGYIYGGRIGPQKIPLEQRGEILRRIHSGENLSAIARDFGLHRAFIRDIKRGRAWKYEAARSISHRHSNKEIEDNG